MNPLDALPKNEKVWLAHVDCLGVNAALRELGMYRLPGFDIEPGDVAVFRDDRISVPDRVALCIGSGGPDFIPEALAAAVRKAVVLFIEEPIPVRTMFVLPPGFDAMREAVLHSFKEVWSDLQPKDGRIIKLLASVAPVG